jgi:uncharacterized protein involved in outer membrane biogenesis
MSRAALYLKRALLGVFALLTLLVAGLAVFLYTFDANRLRPMANEKVSQAIGRPFAIAGNLKLTWLWHQGNETGWRAWIPWPHFTADDIVIGNPDWAKHKEFATVDQLMLEIEALPLLEHEIAIPSIELTRPALHLERRADGRNTWTFNTASAGPPSRWHVKLDTLSFARARITYDDAIKRASVEATLHPLDHAISLQQVIKQQEAVSDQHARATIGAGEQAKLAHQAPRVTVLSKEVGQPYALGWTIAGSYNGAKVSGDGKSGSVLNLKDKEQPFPLHANLTVGGNTHIALVGTLTAPQELAALDLRLWLSGVSMSQLYPLTGIALPDTPPYSTDGHLSGKLSREGIRFEYQRFTGRVGGSDLSGTLIYQARKPRPLLSGTLESRLLRFSDLAPLIGADSNASKLRRGSHELQPAGKALPVEGFRSERLKTIDADVRFKGRRIEHKANLPVQDLDAHILLKDGVLALDPLDFGVAGGTLNSKVVLDGNSQPLLGKVNVEARHLVLPELFPTLQPLRNSLGALDGSAALTGRGNSVAALLASSNGEVKTLMHKGAVSGMLLEEAGLNLANVVMYKLFGDQEVKINCAAADLIDNNGVFATRLFAVDTDTALIKVNGKVDLAHEQVDLTVNPESKGLRLLSLRTPLYVRGSLSKPQVGANVGVIAMKGVAALGLGALAAPLAALVPLTALSPNQGVDCRQMLGALQHPPRIPPYRHP